VKFGVRNSEPLLLYYGEHFVIRLSENVVCVLCLKQCNSNVKRWKFLVTPCKYNTEARLSHRSFLSSEMV